MVVFGMEKLRFRFEHLSGSACGAPRAGIVNSAEQTAARIEALTMQWAALIFLDDAQDFLMPISFLSSIEGGREIYRAGQEVDVPTVAGHRKRKLVFLLTGVNKTISRNPVHPTGTPRHLSPCRAHQRNKDLVGHFERPARKYSLLFM